LFTEGNNEEGPMGKTKLTAVMLMVVLLSQTFSLAAQTAGEKMAAIKEKVAGIPVGSNIEVKFLQKDSSKVKGKLRSVSDDGFEVQLTKLDKIEKIAFADVQSVKRPMRKLYKVLIGVGVWIGVTLAIAAARDWPGM
jgi:hypothetical protein